MTFLRALFVVLMLSPVLPAYSQPTQPPPSTSTAKPVTTADLDQDEKDDKKASKSKREKGDILTDSPDTDTQVEQLMHALARLPIAAGLATLLAMRPRRRGTPNRRPPVVQTQIILAVVGAVVMLVVGSSLARAFGIVGAAGLVRYRARIEDPKDAGVMLSTLAIGLASGVGLWMMAVFGTVFIGLLLWIVESFEPAARQTFALKVKTKNPPALRSAVEQLLRRSRFEYELRGETQDEIAWDVKVPLESKTDRLSKEILDLDPEHCSVQWEEKKEKK